MIGALPDAVRCCTDARTGLYVAHDRTAAALRIVTRADPDQADRGLDDPRLLLAGAGNAAAHAYRLLEHAGSLLARPDRPLPRLPRLMGHLWPRRGGHIDEHDTRWW